MADLTPRRRILAPEQIDNVANAVLALTRELWVTRDRLMILERLLTDQGIDVAARIDQYQPGAEMQAELDQSRDRLIAGIVSALDGAS